MSIIRLKTIFPILWTFEFLNGQYSQSSQPSHSSQSSQISQSKKLQIEHKSYKTQKWTFWRNNGSVSNLFNVYLFPFWHVWVEIKCKLHVAVPNQKTNQFKLVKQSRQQVLRAYCSKVYTYTEVVGEFMRSVSPTSAIAKRKMSE